jgi:YHS domain-containing protein
MTKKLWFAVLLIAVLGLTLWVTAQVPDKAVDPVCGMSVVKDGAKWTYDYNGTTYYFCSEGCKTSFSKEPDKYLTKTAEGKKMGGGMGMMGGQGQGMMRGQMQGAAVPPGKAIDPVCGMTVTKDGAKWTFDYNGTTYYFCSEGCKTSFSKEPQKYLAKMDEAKPMGGGMGMMGGMGGQGQGIMRGQGQGQNQGGMGMMPEMQNMRGQLMRMRNEIDMMMQRMRMMAGRMQGGTGEMQGGMMGGMGGQGQGMMHEQMAAGMPGGMECPMMMEGVDKKVVNTKDGVTVTLTSKDPETVKKLQEHLAKMKDPLSGKIKEDAASGACPGCPSIKIK